MKVFTKLCLALCLLTLQTQLANAQCAFNNTFYGNLTPPAPGTSVSDGCMYAGEYVTVNVVAGETYIFSACANFDDLTMTLYNAPGTVVLGYGDDDCGAAPEIVWTATYTGVVNVLLDYYPCANDAWCYAIEVTWTAPAPCATLEPICTSTGLTFTAGTTGTDAVVTNPINNWNCLDEAPDATWNYIEVATSGNINMTLVGAVDDVDFIIWGPYANLTAAQAACNNYGNGGAGGNVVDCSFSTAATEYPDIIGATAGQVYIMVIANYAGVTQNITLTQTGGTGGTDCSIVCGADAGTYSMTVNGTPLSVGTPAYLCFGPASCINVISNNDYTLPTCPCPGGTPELMYAIYTGAPTTADPDTDPNWTGFYWTGDDFTDCNNGSSVFNTEPTLTGFTRYWLVPITADEGDNDDAFCPGLGHDSDGDGCFDLGTAIELHYLNQINIAGTMNTCTGVATITVTGGLPQDNGSNYTITNTGPGTVAGTPITHNGSITVSGLTNGQTVSLTITDGQGCSRNVTYGPVTVNVPANAGTNGTVTLCSNGSTANLFSSLGGTPATGGTWAGPSTLTGAHLGTYNPVTMTPGVYTYTVLGISPCPNATATVTVTETTAPAATIAYASPFCSSAGVQNVTQTGTAGGSYSATPAGLSLNAANGQVTPGTSTAGTYTVTYTVAASGGCAVYTTTASVTITTAPTATISYASPICTSAGVQNVTQTGTTGGTYSATPAGLSLNAANGQVTPGSSTPGTYTVTYTVAAAGGCPPFTTTASITISTASSATIAYSGSPYCSSAGVQNVTQTGTTGGTYSATPAGLSLNAANGQVTPGTSTAGTYTVTYSIPASGGCAPFSTTASVTITTAPTATIAYAGPFCSSAGVQNVTQTGTTGGTYSATPAGLSLNATTGQITPGTSTAGTYTVTYTVAAASGCPPFTTTASVTITAAPSATIAYPGSPYCSSAAVQNVTQTGTTGGTYSATPAGLSLNATTGQITPGSSTAGTYTVTYTVAAAGGCTVFTTTASVTITPAPTAAISYAGPFCSTAAVQNVTQTGTSGGTYSSTIGLSINAANGQITPSLSTPGTYTVTYSVAAAGGCAPFSTTASVTITPAPTATISYTGPLCTSGATASVTQTGTTGGTYSATPAGLSINATSGLITPASSTAGTYTVTYTVAAAGGCAPFTTTTSVTINPAPTASIAYSGPYCVSLAGVQNVTQTGSTGGTYSATPAGLTLNASNGQITPSASTPGTYTVSYTIAAASGCAPLTTTASVTINPLDNAAFTYSSATYCQTGTDPAATVTGLAGGTFTSTAGIVINSSTGLIDLSASTLGTYAITYTTNGACPNTSTVNITITSAPSATFSYTGAPFCQSGTDPMPTFGPGASAGVFSSSAGLVFVNVNTGEIDLSASTPGTYTVNNNIVASGGCASATASASITIGAAPNAAITYAGSPYCTSVTAAQAVTLTGTGGGTYSATPAGLSIDATTGAITPSTSTAGTYTVNYDIAAAGGCAPVNATATVVITTAPNASITYAGSPYCTSVTAAQAVTQTGSTGGTYSATPAGLTLNATTGEVTPSSSTPGTYTVTYTIAASGGCLVLNTTATVVINATPAFSITGSANPTGCGLADGTVTLGGLTSSTTYTITYDNGSVISLGAVSTDASGNYVITGLSAGTYSSFTVTNAAGCSLVVMGPAILNDPSAPTGSVLSSTDPLSCGGTDGTITLTGLNPSSVYNISYNDGSGVITLTGVTTDASGNYVITGVGAGTYSAFTLQLSGCTGSATGSAILNDPSAPVFTLGTTTDPTACGASDGSITITGLTPSTNYVITYDNGSVVSLGTVTTDASGNYLITGLPAGSYTNFTVTLTACTGTSSTVISLSDPGAPVFSAGSGVNPTSCGGNDGSITLTGLTPSTNYVITYDNGSVVSLGTVTTDASGNYVITGLAAGSYTSFTVTLAGCTGTDNAVIVLTSPGTPVFTVSSTNPTSCGATDGTITISGLTPSTAYDIAYDNGAGTVNLGTVTTDASGNYVITGLGAGTYDDFVVSLAGCDGTSATVIVLTSPGTPAAPVAGTNGTYCAGDAIPDLTATAAAGGTLTWYSDAGLTTVIGTGANLTPSNAAGTTIYYVTETASGCESGAATVTIIVNTVPATAPLVLSASPYCSDDIAPLTASSTGGTINWYSDTLAAAISTGTSFMPSSTAGTVTYYVNENNGACAGPFTFVTVTVIECDTVELVVPTGFSPDGDGNNDVWLIPGLVENYPDNHIEVFTRWGAKIFESDGYTTPWDGTYKGSNLPLGAYYFVIYFNDEATDPMKGTVTIIR